MSHAAAAGPAAVFHLAPPTPLFPQCRLQVLLQLSDNHTDTLGRYAAFLTNILDYIDSYSDHQVQQVCYMAARSNNDAINKQEPMRWAWPAAASCVQVFAVFGLLVAGACRQADGSGTSNDAGGR